jgi:zinc and cadmium transporter
MFEVPLYAFGSVAAVSLISLIGATALTLNTALLSRSLFILMSIAVGALFGDAIIHLIPEAFASITNPTHASLYILAGILGFFILEKFLLWHHHHDAEDEHEGHVALRDERGAIRPLGYLVLLSDGIHNFVDGVIIGAAYLISIEVGIATTVAIFLHEVPHEFSDFALLIHSGFTRARALFLNFLSALPAVAGTALALVFGDIESSLVPIAAAIAAGNFLYIAGSDLVPELHKHVGLGRAFTQFIFILVGIGLMLALLLLE